MTDQSEKSNDNFGCIDNDCKSKLFELTAQLTCAKHEISYLETLLAKNSTEIDEELCYSESGAKENELDLESLPKDLIVMQRRY